VDNRVSEIQVAGRVDERGEEILTPDALAFVEELQRRLVGGAMSCFAVGAPAEKRFPGRRRRISFPMHGRCGHRNGPWLQHRQILSIDEWRSLDPRSQKWRSTR
jgi:hypothetical protein